MTEEPWNKHTPGDPMPCKCGDSVVEVNLRGGAVGIAPAGRWGWGKIKHYPSAETTAWRFVERKGKDVIADSDDEAIAIRQAARRANIEVPG